MAINLGASEVEPQDDPRGISLNALDLKRFHELQQKLEDLEKWSWFIGLIAEKGMITVLEKSRPYKNRGESLLYRLYIKIKLNRG